MCLLLFLFVGRLVVLQQWLSMLPRSGNGRLNGTVEQEAVA
jgi:hypothetical protein